MSRIIYSMTHVKASTDPLDVAGLMACCIVVPVFRQRFAEFMDVTKLYMYIVEFTSHVYHHVIDTVSFSYLTLLVCYHHKQMDVCFSYL